MSGVCTPPVCAVHGAGPAVAPPPDTRLGEVWVTPTTVYVVGGDLFARRSSSGGWCWSRPVEGTTWSAIWGSGEVVWLVGEGGAVARYDGSSFTLLDVGTSEGLQDLWGTAPDDIWVVGDDGTVRHFDGASWNAHDLAPHQDLRGVWSARAVRCRGVCSERSGARGARDPFGPACYRTSRSAGPSGPAALE